MNSFNRKPHCAGNQSTAPGSPSAVARCPNCGVPGVVTRCTSGPHFAALRCPQCQRHLRWVPRPPQPTGRPPVALLEAVRRGSPAPRLAKFSGGTESQRAWAASLRATMLHEARRRSDGARSVILERIEDCAWFIDNGRRPYDAITWPRLDQIVGFAAGRHP